MISYLNSPQFRGQACILSDSITFPSSGHPCVHTSCLTAGLPSLPWPFAALLLFCFGRISDSRDESLSHGLIADVVQCGKRHKLLCPLKRTHHAALTCGKIASFGVSWNKCRSARGAELAARIQSTFQKAAEPCDFSRLSQGLGYPVCLCELMLLLSQCLSSPTEQNDTNCSHHEEK